MKFGMLIAPQCSPIEAATLSKMAERNGFEFFGSERFLNLRILEGCSLTFTYMSCGRS